MSVCRKEDGADKRCIKKRKGLNKIKTRKKKKEKQQNSDVSPKLTCLFKKKYEDKSHRINERNMF